MTLSEGAAAVKQAVEDPPDVVLLDVGLPGGDGFEVAKEMRKKGLREAMIVAITGGDEERDYKKSRESGIDYQLRKPVEFEQLAPLLERHRRGEDR